MRGCPSGATAKRKPQRGWTEVARNFGESPFHALR
jgi:hypothetical protein